MVARATRQHADLLLRFAYNPQMRDRDLCALEPIVRSLPTETDGNRFRSCSPSKQTLPSLPNRLSSDALVITKGSHIWK